MIDRRTLVFLFVLSVSCADKASEPTGAAADAGDTKTDGAKSGDAKAEVAVDTATPVKSDLCKSFDKDAVARALGWEGISKVSGVGGSAKGIRHRTCGFIGKNANTDQHFGVTFSTARELEAEHVGFKAKYEPRAAVGGHETKVAKNDRVVILQMKTPELLVTVDVTEKDKTPAELEPKLEAAAIALVGSLPPDAKAILEKK
jgi:hypothetical protein